MKILCRLGIHKDKTERKEDCIEYLKCKKCGRKIEKSLPHEWKILETDSSSGSSVPIDRLCVNCGVREYRASKWIMEGGERNFDGWGGWYNKLTEEYCNPTVAETARGYKSP